MQIDVRGVHLKLTDPIVEYTQAHVEQALDRYERRVHSVGVRLIDGNGPKGAHDMQCQVEVALRGLPPVVVRETGPDLYAAIVAAARGTKRTIRRSIGKQRDAKRSSAWSGDRRMTA